MKINKLTPNENLRWQSSRMMLPEHVEAIRQNQKEQKRKTKPQIDEQRIAEFARVISDAMDQQINIYVKVFHPYDQLILHGIIESVDQYCQRMKLRHENNEFTWVNLDDIVDLHF